MPLPVRPNFAVINSARADIRETERLICETDVYMAEIVLLQVRRRNRLGDLRAALEQAEKDDLT